MKKLFFILVAVLSVSTSYAQMSDKEMKKAITEAKKIVKEAKKNIESETGNAFQAKKLIDEAMQNEFIKEWDQTWVAAADIYSSLFKNEYDKTIIMGQKYDTLGMYTNLCKWIDYAVTADSLQQIPDSKGKTKNDVRKNMVEKIIAYSGNLYVGGVNYLKVNDYKKAFWLCDKYMSLGDVDLLAEAIKEDVEFIEKSPLIAFYTAYACFNMNDWENCLKYARMSLDDEQNGEAAMEFVCVSYEGMGDTVKWIESLKEGLMKYPTSETYYTSLLRYYTEKNDMGALEQFVVDMIEKDPEKAMNYYVLGFLAQQNKEYDKAIDNFKKAVEKDEKMGEAYNFLCLCYQYKAGEIEQQNLKVDPRSAAGKKVVAEINELYKQTIPYYEKYREVAPDAVSKWGMGLYGVYYRLNMTKEFNEIEKVLQEKGLM